MYSKFSSNLQYVYQIRLCFASEFYINFWNYTMSHEFRIRNLRKPAVKNISILLLVMWVIINADTATISASRMIRRLPNYFDDQITFNFSKLPSSDEFLDVQKTPNESNINISSGKWTGLVHMIPISLAFTWNHTR